MHRSLRRLAVLLLVGVPIALLGRAGATWGASRDEPPPPRPVHPFATSDLARERGDGERAESAVVLVVLDGVRGQEIFGGADRPLAREHKLNPMVWANPRDLTPNLQRALDTDAIAIGVPGHGPEMTATGPRFISMPGYLEIFAGKPDPACDGNECAAPPTRTFVDDVGDASGDDDAAVITSWPNIARAAAPDASRFVVSSGRKLAYREAVLRGDPTLASLLDRGALSKAWPGTGDYRPDEVTAKIALRYLVTAHPRFLFVGLGDADEFGHRNDYRGYLEAVHESDAFLGDLFAALGTMGARGKHTTVLVTADHGRAYTFQDHGARYPESGRVWLVAAGDRVPGHGLVGASRQHTLSDVAPTVRALLGIEGEGSPIPEVFSPPAEPSSSAVVALGRRTP